MTNPDAPSVKLHLPYYPHYVRDFRESRHVRAMNLEQEGLYRRCLDLAWEDGSLPDDPKEIARLIQKDPREVKRAWAIVRLRWEPSGEPGRLVNDRQEKERKKAEERHSKASNAAAQKAAHGRARAPAKEHAQNGAAPPATRASELLSSEVLSSEVLSSEVLNSCSSVVLKEKKDASFFDEERASESFEGYFGIFIATGKPLNDKDMGDCLTEWLSRTPDYREKAYRDAESKCSGWSGDSYTPFPVNHLTKHSWDRRSAGRSLPPVRPQTKVSEALDRATKQFTEGIK